MTILLILAGWIALGLLFWAVIRGGTRRPSFDPQDRIRLGITKSDRERWDAICERAEHERQRRRKAA